MLNRDYLIVGALGFVLGGVVATASITTILMTQSHEEKTCPPIPAVIAPAPTVSSETPTPAATPATVAPPVAPAPAPAPVVAKTPAPVKVAKAEKKMSSLDAEEKDRLTEEQKQLLERKKSLDSQLNDSNEIIRLKEQQIKELEEKLKQ